MTNAQKTAIKISEKEKRVSEIRARLNAIEGLSEAELTAEVRTEQTALVFQPLTASSWWNCGRNTAPRSFLRATKKPRSGASSPIR